MAIAYSKHGWLMTPYSGPELMAVEIEAGGTWTPAYLDYDAGQRIAMIPTMLPEGQTAVVGIRTRPPEIDDGSG